MVENKVYTSNEIDFTINSIEDRPEPKRILMATPDHFDIVDVKNIHMEGNAGKLNKAKAYKEWQTLKETFEGFKSYGILEEVLTIPGAEGCEDMVFTANQSFPWIRKNGEKIVVMSEMRHPSRKREVPFFEQFYKELGYTPIHLNKTKMFEGMGDLIYHTGKRLLYGGYGHRTEKNAYDEIVEILETPIVALELVDERFYHLDTCFVSLGKEAVMICKEAFSDEGVEALKKLYKRVYFIPVDEAVEYFALNAHTLFNHQNNKKVAVIHQGSVFTVEVLKKEGFDIYEVDTTEFMKSGGSVFCMKMMLY